MSIIPKIKSSFKKTVLLALITYILYWVGYGAALFFHDPYIGNQGGPPDFYNFGYFYYSVVGIVFITLVNLMNEIFKIQRLSVVLHALLFGLFIYNTQNNFLHRPYEHLLFTVILGSTIITRPLIDFLLNKYYFRTTKNNAQ